MKFYNQTKLYKKTQRGADLFFQPDNLDEYAGHGWDIRISIADAPLEEAYYFTVADYDASGKTIRQLLSEFALNPAKSNELDIDEYPDLPFMQQELIEYQTNAQKGLFDLKFFINNSGDPDPVNLDLSAKQFMSTCIYHDDSHDYMLLDLIMVADIKSANPTEIEQLSLQFDHIFMLMLLDYYLELGSNYYSDLLNHKPIKSFIETLQDSNYYKINRALNTLKSQGLIKVIFDGFNDEFLETTPYKYKLEITQSGEKKLNDLKNIFWNTKQHYDCFDSVSIQPPALGIPNGFDVRIQMLQLDKHDINLYILIQILGHDQDQWFARNSWINNIQDSIYINDLIAAFSYKTNFSLETLEELKKLAHGSSFSE